MTTIKKQRVRRHTALRPSVLKEVAEASKRTGIAISRLLEQGWELRKKQSDIKKS